MAEDSAAAPARVEPTAVTGLAMDTCPPRTTEVTVQVGEAWVPTLVYAVPVAVLTSWEPGGAIFASVPEVPLVGTPELMNVAWDATPPWKIPPGKVVILPLN